MFCLISIDVSAEVLCILILLESSRFWQEMSLQEFFVSDKRCLCINVLSYIHRCWSLVSAWMICLITIDVSAEVFCILILLESCLCSDKRCLWKSLVSVLTIDVSVGVLSLFWQEMSLQESCLCSDKRCLCRSLVSVLTRDVSAEVFCMLILQELSLFWQ